MADDPVDISGMPDPGTIGLSPAAQTDPTDGMPDPETLYRKYHFGGGLLNANGKPGPMEDIPKDALDEFMANPPDKDTASKNLKTGASALTGLPRVAAVYNPITPTVAAVAGGAGALSGALGAALDPEHAAEHLETGHQRLRDWSSDVYNLANKIPATEAGAKLADYANALPAEIGKNINDTMVRPLAGDNAADTLGDVAQDVGTLLPGAHAPALVRGGAGAVAKGARAAKEFVKSEAASVTPPEPAEDFTTPPVGKPVSGDDLRATTNPIPPPDGTVAAERQKAAQAPQEAPRPAAGETPPTGETTLPETDNAPQDMNLSPDQRALVREGVAARRAAAESQRGSVRLFNAPKDEGPKETATPDQQSERQGHLDALDRLSGGQLPTRRTSALTGDYNATGNDWQAAKTGNEAAQRQLASESDALHAATTNVHNSLGSLSDDSVDPTTLGDRGRTTRGAIQAIEKHFNDATDSIYNRAREQNQGKQIPALARVKAYLDDDSNFTNDAEIGLQRAAKQRLERLWTTGDPDKGTPPGSVNAAERFREFLNEKGKNPNAMGVAKELKGHTDMDVAEHGGPGLFDQARKMRRHQFQMLEEPTGIKKLLTPGDSQGINHAIPEHKVMDYIADLPREQHEQVMNVLRAGAHMDPALAESSANAIREIQAHTISRLHDAATNDGGKWNARDFYNATSRYARNAESTFKDRPDVLKNLKTISDAGNTLHMDKSYPGAIGQAARSGILTGAVKGAGAVASSLAHEIPVVGRILGRGIEGATEAATGDMGKKAAESAFNKRTVDRTGKQRGAVGDLSQRDAVAHEVEDAPSLGLRYHSYSTPHGGGIDVREIPGLGVRKSYRATQPADERGKGWGTRTLQRAVDDAHEAGQAFHSDSQVSESQAGAYANLKKLGYDVKIQPHERVQGELKAHGDHVFEVGPPKGKGSTLNVGLHQGNEGEPGFRKMSKQEATSAIESTGAKTTKSSVLTPNEHGVPEPTLVASTNRPLSEPEMQNVLAKTKQSAIPQRTDAGEESMHVAPGHEEAAKAQGWDKFDANRFRGHPDQRGSVQLFNDNKLNRSTDEARDRQRGAGIEPRNERNERTANQQMGGKKPLSAEQEDIIRRLGGSQRGSVRVMNEKPLTGAPEGDRPNGLARRAAAAYMKSAGIKDKPLSDYRYISPEVAKSMADAYESMPHDPTNPKVKASYDAFKAETLAQYKQMVKAGVKVDLDKSYPYKNPREMHSDVRDNNHMSIYPTEAGFGAEGAAPADHPLLEKAPIKMGGKDATYNDLFRAVHDYYGHAAEGNGFRANGEYNAWRAHRQMYSDAARGAMDAETLGQNSWVNSGPPAALNKGASGADTIYADQKAGLLPPKVVKAAEGGVGADEHHVTNLLTDDERKQLRTDTTKRLVDAFNSTPATKEYAAAALAGAAKRGWYRNSSQAIVNQFGHDAPRFAGLLSAMSPQVSVQTNFTNALKTFVNWDKAGRPENPNEIRAIMEQSSQKSPHAAPGSSNVLDAWVNNSVRALTAEDPSNIKLSGPKVHSFYHNLTDKVNEVTNDAWMSSFAKMDPAKLAGGLTQTGPGKSPSYLALSAKVRDAARTLSHLTGETWTPAEVQETVWSWAKTAYEHAEEKGSNVSIPDLVKNGDITDDLIRSTPDFHQLFGTSEHRGLLQSSSFAGDAKRVAGGESEGTHAAGPSKAREAAAKALRPALISAAERLEQVRQERRNK